MGEDGLQFFPNLVGRGLERRKPREVLTVEEFVGGQERVVQPVAVIGEDRAPAEHRVGGRADPAPVAH